MAHRKDTRFNRRELVAGAGALLAFAPWVAGSARSGGRADKAAVLEQIPRMHAENLRRLQDWIAFPSIAAENLNFPEGAEYMARLARQAGFTDVKLIPTAGKPGVFGRIDAGARTTVAVYFMYDVKQFDPAEWQSPPLEGRLLSLPEVGKVCMGRGAVNQKGPQNSFLSAVMAFPAAGRKLPVNVVLVAEGEEEIGSPNFGEVVGHPEVLAYLKNCAGILLPGASQAADGSIEVILGAKGILEVELISSGAKWGRGPTKDVHSSLAAQVDLPAWRLVQALETLVGPDGHTPDIDGFFEGAQPLSEVQRRMIEAYAAAVPEELIKKELGVTRWVHDLGWQESLLRLYSQPTINIEGLVGGHTGPGGKTILPHKATAKIDMRLVPDMTAQGTLAKLRAHLAKRGFADIEINVTAGYDPTQTDPDSRIVAAVIESYRGLGYTPQVLPRSPGSWPGYRFTNPPLSLPAVNYGLGYGANEHAPDEYYVIESAEPRVQGMDGAIASFADCLYALAA